MAGHSKKDSDPAGQGLFTLSTYYANDGQYRGRFAPSPSGPLHFGSLIAAVASYCQAKAHQGSWLVRIEDIDPPREMPGADRFIIDCLLAHGLEWDEDVVYQSQRIDVYDAALRHLSETKQIFYCSCTRKELREQLADHMTTTVYPGHCRSQTEQRDNCSIRLRIDGAEIVFRDAVYGTQMQSLPRAVGDFVLQRRDGLYSYQLAVVIDDIAQGITEVVRGYDLLDSTQRQMYLYQCLGYEPPDYVHVPLALLDDGKKLSKQTGAKGLDNKLAPENLMTVLKFLGQMPPLELNSYSPRDILAWAVEHWSLSSIGTTSKKLSI